jgi:hypothetical protein
MLLYFVFVPPASNVPLNCGFPASPLCLKSAAATLSTAGVCPFPFPTIPLVDSIATPSTLLRKTGGVWPMTTIDHTPRQNQSSPSVRSLLPLCPIAASCHHHVRAQDSCAPACPDVIRTSLCFFLRIPFHFFSLHILSRVVDFRAAIIKGAH